jgi:hypothetical protein
MDPGRCYALSPQLCGYATLSHAFPGAPRNCAIWQTPGVESTIRNSRPAAAKEKIARICSMLNAGLGPVACGSKQQPALQSLERILSGLMRWSRLSNPGSSMQVRCKWLLEACMSRDDLDHTFRIEELRGMSQYRRTLLLHALLMLKKYGCNALAVASDGSIATLTRCPSVVEADGSRSVSFILHVKVPTGRDVPVGRYS